MRLSLPISSLLLVLMQSRAPMAAAFATSVVVPPAGGPPAGPAARHRRGTLLASSAAARSVVARIGGGGPFRPSSSFPPPLPLPFGGLPLRGGSSSPCGGGAADLRRGEGRQLRASSSAEAGAAASAEAPSSTVGGSGSGPDGDGSDLALADVDADDGEDDLELRHEIEAAATSSLGIAGPSVRPATFGSLPYVDTSTLDTSTPRQHRVLFVLGGPGAGKGTQSERIVSTYKCVHLSVGELLRDRGPSSPHADLIEDCLVHGKIVPVEISLDLLRRAMDDADGAVDDDGRKYGCRIFLVDGFPRNFDNLSGWTDAMPPAASCLGALVYDCPQSVLEERILSRAETSGRTDDNLTSARKRFRTFRTQTMPVVRALEEVERIQDEGRSDDDRPGRGGSCVRVKHIMGTGTVEEVWDETRTVMDGFVANDVLSASARLVEAVNGNDVEAYARLCDAGMFVGEREEVGGEEKDGKASAAASAADLKGIFDEYERAGGSGGGAAVKSEVANACVEIHDGTRAVVSYDRTVRADDGEGGGGEVLSSVRETRVWSHGERGWTCIHFYRTPL